MSENRVFPCRLLQASDREGVPSVKCAYDHSQLQFSKHFVFRFVFLVKGAFFLAGYYKHIKRCSTEAERVRRKYDYASILGLPKLPKQALTVKDMIDIKEQGKEWVACPEWELR